MDIRVKSNENIMCGIIGRAGTGKTDMMLKLLKTMFISSTHVIVISQSDTNAKLYLNSYCMDYMEEFDSDIVNAIILKHRTEKVVIIFDDCKTSRTNKYIKLTNELYTKGRNYNVHMFFISQRYEYIPCLAWSNLNMIITFEILDKHTRREIAKEFNELTCNDYDSGLFEDLYLQIQGKKYSYIIGTSEGTRMFINNKTRLI